MFYLKHFVFFAFKTCVFILKTCVFIFNNVFLDIIKWTNKQESEQQCFIWCLCFLKTCVFNFNVFQQKNLKTETFVFYKHFMYYVCIFSKHFSKHLKIQKHVFLYFSKQACFYYNSVCKTCSDFFGFLLIVSRRRIVIVKL